MRDKLIDLIMNSGCVSGFAGSLADYLIANGVTFATDNNVACVHKENDKCKLYSDKKHTSWCLNGPCADQRLSNGDRIRAMSDEELAEFLDCFSCCAVCREAERLDDNPLLRGEKCDEDCETHIFDWLKEPVGDNDGQ